MQQLEKYLDWVPEFRLDSYNADVSAWSCPGDEAYPMPDDIGVPFLELALVMSVLDMGYGALNRVWVMLWADAEMAYSGAIGVSR